MIKLWLRIRNLFRDIQLSSGSLMHKKTETYSSKRKITGHSYSVATYWETYFQKALFFESGVPFVRNKQLKKPQIKL